MSILSLMILFSSGNRPSLHFSGTTPSWSQELLQLLQDCFGGAVPAATDGHFCLAKIKTNLTVPRWVEQIDSSSYTMKKMSFSRAHQFLFLNSIREIAFDWLCVQIRAFDWLIEMLSNFGHVWQKIMFIVIPWIDC